ncbi:hypothetical protein QZH41_020176, partial [Actinostola sp. cb2023]
FVSNTIPFGWKLSAWIYHSTGLVATHFFRSIGIPSSLYIDDRHIGELQLDTPGTIPLSATPRDRTKLTNAQDAVYVVAYTLSHLGYTLGLPKCVLTPQKQIKFLGFISDTEQEAFYLPINKQKDFLALVASILAKRHVSVHTLQRLAGKCSSFNLAIQDARLYTNEMNMAIGKALKTSKPAHLSPALRLEIERWASPEVVSKEHPRFGGPSGHSIDLMALDSNTQDGKDGKPLSHFTPYPMPGSSGVDIFAQDLSSPESDPLLRNLYVFPPIILIGPVIRLLQENNCSSTIVIPDVRPRRYWWPTLNHVARTSLRLASRGQLGAIRPPSKEGYRSEFNLPWDLWAFRL